jgi:hypothetical protein
MARAVFLAWRVGQEGGVARKADQGQWAKGRQRGGGGSGEQAAGVRWTVGSLAGSRVRGGAPPAGGALAPTSVTHMHACAFDPQ